MFAIRQIIEDPQDVIAIPPELRHRRTEVIFIAIDQEPESHPSPPQKPTLASLAGCWTKPLTQQKKPLPLKL
jgi:hypothetical protein